MGAYIRYVFMVWSVGFLTATAPSGTLVTLSKYALPPMSESKLRILANEFEVLRAPGGGYEIIIPLEKSQDLVRNFSGAVLLEKDISAGLREAFRNSRIENASASGYHSFVEVQSLLKDTAQKFSSMTQLIPYGRSAKGLPLTALRAGLHLSDGLARPRLMLTAATHGDEIITTEVLLSLMNTLLNRAAAGEPRFVKMLEDHEIIFIPVVNADGFSSQNRYDGSIDPNRSYPYPQHEDQKASPSIAAEMKFVSDYPIVGSIDFHAYSAVVIYPWGYTDHKLDPSIEQTFRDLSVKMTTTNGYRYGEISDIMYISPGSSCDFWYLKYGAISLGIELGRSKSPPPSEFPAYIKEQEESTWIFVESFNPPIKI